MSVHNPYDDAYLLALIVIIDALCDAIVEDTGAIREVTDSEAILTETGGTFTTDGTEQTIYIANTPAGIFRPICFKLDTKNQTATETIDVKVYYRIQPSPVAMVLQSNTTFAGAQDPDLINVDLEPVRWGIEITVQNTAIGTHREYAWQVFYEEAP